MTIREDFNKSITTKAFISRLRIAVRELGGPIEASKAWGVPYQRISNAIHGYALPSEGILKAMGFRSLKAISYRYEEL